MISAGDFKNGLTLEIDGNVVQIMEFQHVKPGKGAAFVRTKLKNVISGGIIERTFRPTEKFPQARIERVDMQYLYSDGDLFMKLNKSPSLYKYCISTRSIRACGNFSVGLKVLSIIPPLITFFNFVLTNAAPLPGLTCWNSIICTTLPSICSVRPFLKSPADIIMIFLLISYHWENLCFFHCTSFYNTSGQFSTVFSLSLLFLIKIQHDFFQFPLYIQSESLLLDEWALPKCCKFPFSLPRKHLLKSWSPTKIVFSREVPISSMAFR